MPVLKNCARLFCFLAVFTFAAGQAQNPHGVNPVGEQEALEHGPAPLMPAAESSSPENDARDWARPATHRDFPPRMVWPLARHFLEDQQAFWTSPFRLRRESAWRAWPFFAMSGSLLASDHWIMKQVPTSPAALQRSRDFSNLGLVSLAAGAGAAYLWGGVTHDEHLKETGILSAEAALNTVTAGFALKILTGRARPPAGAGVGGFGRAGSSFPSEHAALAWSMASVVAHEYPGPLTRWLAYGLASGITASRVTSREHFPADAFVGAALGWYVGRQVYRTRHDPELGGTAWGSFEARSPGSEEPSPRSPGSPYVPLQSWIYPALERLAAWGYVQTEMLGQRPWTRMECVRLLEEADAAMPEEIGGEAARIYRRLQEEFLPERNRLGSGRSLSARLESIYTAETSISGPPLTDSYNFGTTIVNQNGRPFERGMNLYSGASAYGTAGSWAFYVRAEYQHAPFAPGFPALVREAVASQEGVTAAPYAPFAEINRARMAEGYVSLAWKGVQFSFGKQRLWWGPTETGPLLWSTNAEPVPMLRLSQVEPFALPSFLHWLGPMQTEFFLGQLAGHRYIVNDQGVVGPVPFHPQPYIHGQKLSFRPTPNLEIGLSRTVIFSGLGHPFTFLSFAKSLGSGAAGTGVNVHGDEGDRRAGFDFRYRIPHLRKWLTLYSDAFCDDNVSPLAAPHRSAWSPGLYLAQLPRLPRFDFRAEGVYTDSPGFHGSGVNYQNVIYRSGYTNDGNIIGSWIGRQGRGLQLWTTYWISPESKIQASYRHQGVSRDFLQGGTLDDISVRADLVPRPEFTLSAFAQYERWRFPLLAPGGQANLAVSLNLTYRPKWGVAH